jgi:hypothetical protein
MAEVIYFAGTDPWETKSAMFTTWIMGGANPDKKLVFALPRKSTGVAYGEKNGGLHLPVIPGTDVALHLAMIRVILENGWEDREFIEKWVSNQWEIDSGFGRGPRNTPVEWFTTWGRYGVGFADYKKWILGYKYAELATAAQVTGGLLLLDRLPQELVAHHDDVDDGYVLVPEVVLPEDADPGLLRDRDRALARDLVAGQDAQEGRLAGPVGAHQGDELTLVDRQVVAAQDGPSADRDGDVACLDDGDALRVQHPPASSSAARFCSMRAT